MNRINYIVIEVVSKARDMSKINAFKKRFSKTKASSKVKQPSDNGTKQPSNTGDKYSSNSESVSRFTTGNETDTGTGTGTFYHQGNLFTISSTSTISTRGDSLLKELGDESDHYSDLPNSNPIGQSNKDENENKVEDEIELKQRDDSKFFQHNPKASLNFISHPSRLDLGLSGYDNINKSTTGNNEKEKNGKSSRKNFGQVLGLIKKKN